MWLMKFSTIQCRVNSIENWLSRPIVKETLVFAGSNDAQNRRSYKIRCINESNSSLNMKIKPFTAYTVWLRFNIWWKNNPNQIPLFLSTDNIIL